MIVAIDGPAASGKSTAAIGVAKALNITHLDTGAMYRAITYGLLKNKIEFTDLDAVEAYLSSVDLKFFKKNKITKLLLNDSDITENIRSNNINENVSEVSAIKIVRDFMVKFQREMSCDIDCVLEGRDIGTVVCPNADVKIFVDADNNVRAKRRVKQFAEQNLKMSYSEVLADLNKRDEQDRNRKIAPMIASKSALLLNTSNMTVKQSLDIVILKINAELKKISLNS